MVNRLRLRLSTWAESSTVSQNQGKRPSSPTAGANLQDAHCERLPPIGRPTKTPFASRIASREMNPPKLVRTLPEFQGYLHAA